MWLSVLPAHVTTVLCVQYTMQCHSSPQLVEVAGCNVWVMEETDGPCSDRPQTGHLRQKVHAQQHPLHSSPVSSLERNTAPPRVTGTYGNVDSVCVIERGMPHAQLTSLVQQGLDYACCDIILCYLDMEYFTSPTGHFIVLFTPDVLYEL